MKRNQDYNDRRDGEGRSGGRRDDARPSMNRGPRREGGDRRDDRSSTNQRPFDRKPFNQGDRDTNRPFNRDRNESPRPRFSRDETTDRRGSFDRGEERPQRTYDRPRSVDRNEERPRSFDRDRNNDRPQRSFDKSRSSDRSDDRRSGRPFDRDRNDTDRKPFDRDRPRSFDRDNDRRPFDRGERPFSRRDDREDSPRDARPPRTFDRNDDRPRRSFDREANPRDDRRPFDRDNDRPARSFDRNRDDDRPGRTYDKPRSYDRDDRDGASRPARPFDRDRNNDRARTTNPRPYNRDNDRDDRKPFDRRSEKQDEKPGFDRRAGRFEKAPNYNIDKMKENLPRSKKVAKNLQRESDPDSIRLNRYIANSGVCSRREADELIGKGDVQVNGTVVTEMGYRVKPGDVVKYGNKVLNPEKMVYVLLNKPKDVITTTDDPEERNTVMDIVADAGPFRLYPVGRLDRNTTGLLLMTNDGELASKLTHPSNNVKKVYQVELDKPITEEHFEAIRNGLELEDGFIKPDDLAIVTPDAQVVGVEIHSGRNRIVRRMFETLGYEVTKLDRTVFAGLTKKELPRGKWRFLEPKEVVKLKYLT
jgi:23S rRNA pseudouridine2605 synthase